MRRRSSKHKAKHQKSKPQGKHFGKSSGFAGKRGRRGKNRDRDSSDGSKSQRRGKSRRSQGSGKRLSGRVQKHPRGFAFLICDDRNVEDAYVDRREAQDLMTDDRVEYTIYRQGGGKAYAEIHEIVERGQREIVGKVRWMGEQAVVMTAEGEPFPLHHSGPPPVGNWVIARIDEYPSSHSPGHVTVIEKLGPDLLPRHDLRIAASRFHLGTEFPAKALEEAKHASALAKEVFRNPGERHDLRKLPFVTVDGEDAKDFDDAILVETPQKGPAFILYVAIADVSFYVVEGSALDREAYARGTSVYFPGTCLPMLPEELSNDLCSLRPQTDKLTLTAEIHLDREGKIEDARFYESIIRTAKRLTYRQLQDYFDHKSNELSELEKPLKAAFQLYRKMLHQRKNRGVLDFDLPESKIEVDENGMPIKVHRVERLDSHRLIEEFMIAANQVVARALKKAGILALHRVHEQPEPSTVDDVNQLMKRLGFNKYLKEISTHALSEVLAATADQKGAKTLHQAILRLQKQARYEPAPRGHFGLALEDYAHFTSPIRRYPDLVVHRSLKRLIRPGKKTDRSNDEARFEKMGQDTSDRERRAMEAERYVVKRKQCWFMQQHLGERFKGEITGIIERGIFVEIKEFALDGFLPIEELKEKYVFDEQRNCLRRQPGHSVLTLGDEVEFQVVRVSLEDNEITFSQREQ